MTITFADHNVTENVTEHSSLNSSSLLFHIKRKWPNHRNNMRGCSNYSWSILFSKPTRSYWRSFSFK